MTTGMKPQGVTSPFARILSESFPQVLPLTIVCSGALWMDAVIGSSRRSRPLQGEPHRAASLRCTASCKRPSSLTWCRGSLRRALRARALSQGSPPPA